MGTTTQICTWVFPHIQLLYWLAALLSCVLVLLIPEIQSWHRYGKLRSNSSSYLDSFVVRKHYFAVFYVLGGVWTCALVVSHGGIVNGPTQWMCEMDFVPTFRSVNLLVFALHCARRLYEDWNAPKSDAEMHVAGFLVGLSFYGFAPLAMASCPVTLAWSGDVFVLGIMVVVWGSYYQHECHMILRNSLAKSKTYGFPRGGWFEFSSSPHYLAEIIIYLGFTFIIYSNSIVSIEWLLTVAFTTVNLCVTGAKTHTWYVDKFGDEARKRWRVIPYVF